MADFTSGKNISLMSSQYARSRNTQYKLSLKDDQAQESTRLESIAQSNGSSTLEFAALDSERNIADVSDLSEPEEENEGPTCEQLFGS